MAGIKTASHFECQNVIARGLRAKRQPFSHRLDTYLITLRVKIVVPDDDDLEPLIRRHFERLIADLFDGEEQDAFQSELDEFVFPLTSQQRTRSPSKKKKKRVGGYEGEERRGKEIVVSGTSQYPINRMKTPDDRLLDARNETHSAVLGKDHLIAPRRPEELGGLDDDLLAGGLAVDAFSDKCVEASRGGDDDAGVFRV